MSTKHTPGPWRTEREGFSTVYVEARIDGGLIQEVAACGPTEAGLEQQEANASLIAAAPDLLEALKEMVAGDAEAIEEAQALGVPFPEEMLATFKKARAAIARATGETT